MRHQPRNQRTHLLRGHRAQQRQKQLDVLEGVARRVRGVKWRLRRLRRRTPSRRRARLLGEAPRRSAHERVHGRAGASARSFAASPATTPPASAASRRYAASAASASAKTRIARLASDSLPAGGSAMTARSGAHFGPTSRTASIVESAGDGAGAVQQRRPKLLRQRRERAEHLSAEARARGYTTRRTATCAARRRRRRRRRRRLRRGEALFAESESVPSVVAARSVPSAAREAIVTVFVFSDDDVFVEATIALSVA